MKPDPDAVLGYLAGLMVQTIAPQVQPQYLAGVIGMSGMLLGMAAQEWDRAADRLVKENRAIRGLFRQAERVGLDADLAQEVRALAGGQDDDLRISALESVNTGLRAALISLHAAVETRTDAASRALNDAIWAELSASTSRRAYTGSPF
ncbi:MAG: hypothetical protein P4L73_14410 [Caulobacteraceae bacterium]|nr:hypothetical protein [Caulobacteraceae bacterium]